MILPLAFVIGFALGWRRAARRDGELADRVQWGIGHGIGFTLLALLLTVIADRAGLL